MAKEFQPQSPVTAVNLLSEGTTLTGDLSANSDIRVDGSIKGNIKTSGRVVVGASAHIEGNIDSAGVDVIGNMEGNILSSGMVVLRDKSMFTGVIRSTVVTVEAGAVFNGECRIEKASEPAARPPLQQPPATPK